MKPPIRPLLQKQPILWLTALLLLGPAIPTVHATAGDPLGVDSHREEAAGERVVSGSTSSAPLAVVLSPAPDARARVAPRREGTGLDSLLQVGAACEAAWTPDFGGIQGINWIVRAFAVFDDGSGTGPALHVGGTFTMAGGVVVNSIAKRDDAAGTWVPLGSGMGGGGVSDLVVFDDGSGAGPALYAAGEFTTAGGVNARNVAKWDGTAWSALGGGMNNPWGTSEVHALAVFDDGSGPALYAGGFFTTAGTVSATGIAKWKADVVGAPGSWSAVGGGVGGSFPTVKALAVQYDESGAGSALLVGGFFTTAGGVPASRIAHWDGAAWSALGAGVSGGTGDPGIYALTVFDDGSGNGPALYAGGNFTTAGGITANRVARWSLGAWSPLSGGMNEIVEALAVYDDGSGDALYAGGWFTSAGGLPANHIARWSSDANAWSPLGSGMNARVYALGIHDDGTGAGPALYAGGAFTTAGGLDASRIAKWQGCPAPPALGLAYCFGDGSGTACPCGNAGGAGAGCANSTGEGAVLGATGSAGVGAGDLVLAGAELPPGQIGLYLQGLTQSNAGAGLVFGDGLRCTGFGVVRLQLVHADSYGNSNTSIDIAAEGNVTPGDTRTYQLWYRDSQGSPCGSGFNLSNGLELAWQP